MIRLVSTSRRHATAAAIRKGSGCSVKAPSSSYHGSIRTFSGMDPMLTTYNDNSSLQETCQMVGNPILETFSQELGLPNRGGRLAEFGCSGGRNSVEPVRSVVGKKDNDHHAATKSDVSFEVILEDLPSNPWHQVTAIMEEQRNAMPNVTFLCAGSSFYNPVCAPSSVDLAYSYVSVHFLSDAPPLADHLIYHESSDERTKKAWAERAADDWERLLLLRGQELKSGGKVLLSTMGRDENNGYSWKIFSSAIWDAMHRAGSLTSEEIAILRIPTCLRSEEDVMAPFLRDGGPVSKLFAVDDLEFRFTQVEGEDSLPASKLGPLYRRRVEAVWGGVLIHQLVSLGRSEKDAAAAMSKVWDEYEKMVSDDPSLGWLFMQCYYLQLTKL